MKEEAPKSFSENPISNPLRKDKSTKSVARARKSALHFSTALTIVTVVALLSSQGSLAQAFEHGGSTVQLSSTATASTSGSSTTSWATIISLAKSSGIVGYFFLYVWALPCLMYPMKKSPTSTTRSTGKNNRQRGRTTILLLLALTFASQAHAELCHEGFYGTGRQWAAEGFWDGVGHVVSGKKLKINKYEDCGPRHYCPGVRMNKCNDEINNWREYKRHPCSPGKFSNSPRAGSCQQCQPGRYQNELKASSCRFCGPGKFADTDGSSSCAECPEGKIGQGNKRNRRECQICRKGKRQTFRQGWGQKKNICQSCSAGSYQPSDGQTKCKACEKGKFQNLSGKIRCEGCQPGKYSATDGAKQCIKCGRGKYSTGWKTQCSLCPAGKNGAKLKLRTSNCVGPCPSGKYSKEGDTACKKCLKGYYGGTEGSRLETCTSKCPKGKYSEGGQEGCFLCPAGKFGEVEGLDSSSCSGICPEGRYSHEGSSSCSNCAAGYEGSTKSQETEHCNR
jgi:hypothetical protein